MKKSSTPINTINQYISTFPSATQKLLVEMLITIKKAAPQAEETIGYGIPTLKLEGNLVHFAGYKNHIGFYPSPSGIVAFKKELSIYNSSKGAIQFPIDKALPIKLITKIVKFRVAQNLEKAKEKSKKNCKNGHTFYKTSDCPTCPICEKERKPKNGFLSALSAPAIRALENKGIKTVQQLSKYKENDILKLHGVGPSAIPKLKTALQSAGLSFKK